MSLNDYARAYNRNEVRIPEIARAYNRNEVRIPEIARPTYSVDSVAPDAPDAETYIRVKDLHARGILGEGEVVAIVDTGLDAQRAEEQRKQGLLHSAISFTGENPLAATNDHGTHVAGIVRRVAPRAKLMIVQVLNAQGSGSYQGIHDGIEWALKNGATQVCCSFGGPGGPDSALSRFFNAMRAKYGKFIGAAAGNDGCSTARPADTHTPGSAISTCSVANTDYRTGGVATSSSCGETVDVAAPGYRILSWILSSGTTLREGLKTGTSMAAPFVVGVAALLASAGVPHGQERDYIQRSARNTALDDIREGSGIVDAESAYSLYLRENAPPPVPAPVPVPQPEPEPEPTPVPVPVPAPAPAPAPELTWWERFLKRWFG